MVSKSKVSFFENLFSTKSPISIIGHHNPDGDTVGSICAMYYFLKDIGIDSNLFLPGEMSGALNFLNKDEIINFYNRDPQKCDKIIKDSELILCFDFNKLARTESMAEVIRSSNGFKVIVDHHPNPAKEEFDLVFSDSKYSSTCEFLYWILKKTKHIGNNISKFPFRCAESLATGMITDTNNFNNSVIPSTFKMSSELLTIGVSLEEINKAVFNSFSEQRMRLMGRLLTDGMVILGDIRAAYQILSLKIQKEYDYEIGDSEGFVNYPLSIRGVSISAFFTETPDRIRVSFRTDGFISVNEFSALYFNGGGHEKAAGGTLYMPIPEVASYFEKSLREYIEKKGTSFAK